MAGAGLKAAAIIGLASGLTVFDETSLGTALPTLQDEFGASATTVKWVVNAYLVVLASLVAACSRLADWLPALALWRTGLAIFAVSSLAAGFAPSIDWLIAFRASQGVGASLIFGMSVLLIGRIYSRERRGAAFGVFSAFVSLLLILGPALGGAFTHYLSWRWIFWATILPAIWCMFSGSVSDATRVKPIPWSRFDVMGAMTFAVAVFALTLALMEADDWRWEAIAAVLLLAVASSIVFVRRELSTSTPLIHLHLLRNPTVAAGFALLFAGQYRRISTAIFVALFLREGLGLNPFRAGLALLPSFIPLIFTTVIIGRLADKYGSRPVIITGLGCLAFAVAGIAVAIGVESYWLLLPALILIGTTAPSTFGPARKAMLNALDERHHAEAGGLSVTVQMLGGTLGISVGTMLLHLSGSLWVIFAALTIGIIFLWGVCFLVFER